MIVDKLGTPLLSILANFSDHCGGHHVHNKHLGHSHSQGASTTLSRPSPPSTPRQSTWVTVTARGQGRLALTIDALVSGRAQAKIIKMITG